MIDIGPYGFSIMTAVTAVIALMWLVTLLLAAVLPANRSAHGLRKIDIFVIIFTIAFGVAWFVGMLYTKPSKAAAQAAGPARSCVSVKAGQSEAKVRELLGDPDEIRAVEEVRGPGANVWIYRNSRCAVHTLSGTVLSVE